MARVKIDAGVCGFVTLVNAESEDGQEVRIQITSGCPHVTRAAPTITKVDSYQEIFATPAQTETYRALAGELPHVACPVYAGVLKAVEAAAGLALPRPSTITFEEP